MEPEFNTEFEKVIWHHFYDRSLMEEALEETGVASAGDERLALLGDKILALMLLHCWYHEGNTIGMSASAAMGIGLIEIEQGIGLLQTYACNKRLTSMTRV